MNIGEELLRSLLPGWMLRTPYTHWRDLSKAVLKVIGATFDDIDAAVAASMPGQVVNTDDAFPNADALPIVGRGRRLQRGKYESDADYALRLRYWLEAWKAAGTNHGLLLALRAVLSPNPPTIRIVRGGYLVSEGYWWTIDDNGIRYQERTSSDEHNGIFWPSDGSAPVSDTTAAHSWNWDSSYWTGPTNPDPSRIWVIIEGPANLPDLEEIEGTFGDGLSTFNEVDANGDKLTIGTTATKPYVEIVRSVCSEFKAAGCKVDHILVSFGGVWNPSASEAAPDYPDGFWKYHGRNVTYVNEGHEGFTKIRARSTLGRYWAGTV